MKSEREASPPRDIYRSISVLSNIVQKLQENLSRMEERFPYNENVTLACAPLLVSDSYTQTEPGLFHEAASAPEPRVPIPERFSGDRKRFRTLRNSCELYFSLLPRIFTSENIKVGFIIMLLLDEPLSWAHHLREQHDPVLTTTDFFFSAMAQLYADPFYRQTAESMLGELQQGPKAC